MKYPEHTRFSSLLNLFSSPMIGGAVLLFCIFSYFYLDREIAVYFHAHSFPMLDSLSQILTIFGLSFVDFSALIFLFFFFRYLKKDVQGENAIKFLLLCLGIATFIAVVFKVLLSRARPELWFLDNLYGFYGFKLQGDFWSFPSGHTTIAISLSLGLGFLYPRFCIAFFLFGLAVAFSRVILTFHYLSDVVATTYLSGLEMGLIFSYFKRRDCLVFA